MRKRVRPARTAVGVLSWSETADEDAAAEVARDVGPHARVAGCTVAEARPERWGHRATAAAITTASRSR